MYNAWNQNTPPSPCKKATLARFPGYLFLDDGSIFCLSSASFVTQNGANKAGYRTAGLWLPSGIKKYFNVHVLICEAFHGAKPKGHVVDHIDQHKLNNAASNLRYVTYSQNSRNCTRIKPPKSPFVGVSWHRKNRKWVASIGLYKKVKYLGYFEDEVAAACRYDEEAVQVGRQPNFDINSPSVAHLLVKYFTLLAGQVGI